jgi:pyruvate,water dikinase
LLGPIALSDLVEDHRGTYGAKAVNLGLSMRIGVLVPGGFAVSFEVGESPAEQRDDLVEAWRALGSPPVAVRSSAVGEDGDEASFAGQYETVLDVTTEDALIEAITTCVASTTSDRAVAYRAQAGVALERMGVVVQEMVAADFAGVCFTRSPGGDDEIVVEVVRGLGEALVSGQATPTRARFTREGAPISSDDHDGILDAFGHDRAARVALLAVRAEAVVGGTGVDIEWASAGDDLFLLQARPITTGEESAERDLLREREVERLAALAGDDVIVWSDISLADMLAGASPLTVDVFRRALGPGGGFQNAFVELGMRPDTTVQPERLLETICGRAYFDLDALIRVIDEGIPIALDTDAFAGGASPDFDPVDPPSRIAWSPLGRFVRLPLTLLRWVRVGWRFLKLRRTFHTRWFEELQPALLDEAASLRRDDLGALSRAELADRFQTLVERLTSELFTHHQTADSLALTTHRFLVALLRLMYGVASAEREVDLTVALEGNFNTESNLALARVANSTLSLEDFLELYGHRGNPDWDVHSPRWREKPDIPARLAEQIAAADVDPIRHFRQQRDRREAAVDRFESDLSKHMVFRWFRGLIRQQLVYYQQYSPLRETTQAAAYLWIELLRQVLLEGERRLGCGDLLGFLTVDEVIRLLGNESVLSLLQTARTRRREWTLARGIHVPHIVVSTDIDAIGRPPILEDGATELSGLAASTGVVRGRARVVHGLHEAIDLKRGEILVTASTDPAWTPLFLIAGGLVLEQGGMLSHGAIVAREYGLPAVINVPDVTRIVHDGQEVVVDGDRGVVQLVPP